jgi:hypothetical protein
VAAACLVFLVERSWRPLASLPGRLHRLLLPALSLLALGLFAKIAGEVDAGGLDRNSADCRA